MLRCALVLVFLVGAVTPAPLEVPDVDNGVENVNNGAPEELAPKTPIDQTGEIENVPSGGAETPTIDKAVRAVEETQATNAVEPRASEIDEAHSEVSEKEEIAENIDEDKVDDSVIDKDLSGGKPVETPKAQEKETVDRKIIEPVEAETTFDSEANIEKILENADVNDNEIQKDLPVEPITNEVAGEVLIVELEEPTVLEEDIMTPEDEQMEIFEGFQENGDTLLVGVYPEEPSPSQGEGINDKETAVDETVPVIPNDEDLVDEPLIFEEESIVEEPVIIEEAVIYEEPGNLHDPVMIYEPFLPKDSTIIEEPDVFDEVITFEEPTIFEEPVIDEEIPMDQEPITPTNENTEDDIVVGIVDNSMPEPIEGIYPDQTIEEESAFQEAAPESSIGFSDYMGPAVEISNPTANEPIIPQAETKENSTLDSYDSDSDKNTPSIIIFTITAPISEKPFESHPNIFSAKGIMDLVRTITNRDMLSSRPREPTKSEEPYSSVRSGIKLNTMDRFPSRYFNNFFPLTSFLRSSFLFNQEEPMYYQKKEPAYMGFEESTYMRNDEPTYMGNDEPTFMGNDQPTFMGNDQPTYMGFEESTYMRNDEPTYMGNDEPTYMGNDEPTFMGNDRPLYMVNDESAYMRNEEPAYMGNEEPSFMGNEEPSFMGNEEPSYMKNEIPDLMNYDAPSYGVQRVLSDLDRMRAAEYRVRPRFSYVPYY